MQGILRIPDEMNNGRMRKWMGGAAGWKSLDCNRLQPVLKIGRRMPAIENGKLRSYFRFSARNSVGALKYLQLIWQIFGYSMKI